MVNLNPRIFRAYDIRGIYGQDFDVAFVMEMANKIAVHLNAKKIVVARDVRPSSPIIEQKVIESLLEANVDIVSIGISTTPLFYYSTIVADADAGIMITASHNPNEYNGLKVLRRDGILMNGEQLKVVYENTELSIGQRGTLCKKDFSTKYAERIIEESKIQSLNTRVCIDIPETEKPILEKIMQHVGIQINDSTLHVEFDSDTDRIYFTEHGKRIPSEFIFMLLVENMGFKRVVHDFRFSRSIKQRLSERGIAVAVSHVGRFLVAQKMREHNAEFGGEKSGHFFFRAFHYLEAPELVLLLILDIVEKSGKTLSELVQGYREYVQSEEISIPLLGEWDEIQKRLKRKYKDGRHDMFDGVTIEYGDWWFNIRPSNTEPVLRLIVEAKTEDLFKEKLKEVQGVIAGIIK